MIGDSNKDLFEDTRMSFGEHLEDLRKALFKAAIGLAIGCAIGFTFANQVVEWLGTIVTAQQDRAQEVVDQLPLPF